MLELLDTKQLQSFVISGKSKIDITAFSMKQFNVYPIRVGLNNIRKNSKRMSSGRYNLRLLAIGQSERVKNMIRVLVTAWISLALNGVSFAEAKPVTPVAPAVSAPQIKTKPGQATVLTGKVMSVDPKTGNLTIKTKEREIKLTTDSMSTRAALEKLKVGDTAKVFEKAGKVIAASPLKADSKMKPAE